jgi:hypothetical protein
MHTREWLRYFEGNAKEVLKPEPDGYRLTDEERRRITRSIQGFQIGEASEGKHLRAGAEAFAQRTGNDDYPKAIAYLIREENRHSAYLGRFMRDQGIPMADAKWSDAVFRFLRRGAGIELSVRVLVTAELLAVVYYDCLAQATGSLELQRICRRMVDEEARHIEFQMHHVHWMNLGRPLGAAALANLAHALLFLGTMAVVWIEHGSVLRVKHGLGSYCRAAWGHFLKAMYAGATSALAERDGAVYETAGVALRHA